MTKIIGPLRVVFLQEGDLWIAQCLEHDIAAQSRSFKKLPMAFMRVLISHVLVRTINKQKPFEEMLPAPKEYWDMFQKGEQTDAEPENISPIYPTDGIPFSIVPPRLEARISA